MKRHLNWLACIACLAIAGGGCGEKQVPPSTYPGARRDLMENPSLYAAKIKALKEGKDVNSVKIEDPTNEDDPQAEGGVRESTDGY